MLWFLGKDRKLLALNASMGRAPAEVSGSWLLGKEKPTRAQRYLGLEPRLQLSPQQELNDILLN